MVDATAGGITSAGGISVNGGLPGSRTGGNGGSGGGGWGVWNTSIQDVSGGYDGSDGGLGYTQIASKGQGYTTRAFGESEGTLYAGGGGGIREGNDVGTWVGGNGGAGGGGNAGTSALKSVWVSTGSGYYSSTIDYITNGGDGGVNSGGGAGSTNLSYSVNQRPGIGGSGIAIIRWGY